MIENDLMSLLLTIVGVTATAMAVMVSVPLVVFAIECLLSLLPSRTRNRTHGFARKPCAVLIPAHDEEASIGATVRRVREQLAAGDTVLVVADNCHDSTSERAREAGAEVLERADATLRGKGYALTAGVRQLMGRDLGSVVFVDADLRVGPGLVDTLASSAELTGRPSQGCNLIEAPENPSPRDRVSALAFLFKNYVRLLGLQRIGGSCHLSTGFALPMSLVRPDLFASGHIAEDMELGLALAEGGHPALYCPSVGVRSSLPSQDRAATTQRTRWEHGHLSLLLGRGPALLARAITRGRWSTFLLALDTVVPPLSLLAMIGALALAVGASVAIAGGTTLPLVISGGSVGLAALGFLLAWARHGRDVVPFSQLAAIPFYIFWKIPVYLRFAGHRERTWIRTDRDTPATGTGQPVGESLPGA